MSLPLEIDTESPCRRILFLRGLSSTDRSGGHVDPIFCPVLEYPVPV